MDSPLVAVAFGCLVLWGLVLILQSAIRRDPPHPFYGFAESSQQWDPDYAGVRHPDERHPRRLLAAGLGLVLAGVAGVVVWGTVFY